VEIRRRAAPKDNWCGYPLNDEVLVTWSSDPEQWSPINHSCYPNAWRDGLDLVARRPIEAGE
jgi:D-alanine-D-alanine ligase